MYLGNWCFTFCQQIFSLLPEYILTWVSDSINQQRQVTVSVVHAACYPHNVHVCPCGADSGNDSEPRGSVLC